MRIAIRRLVLAEITSNDTLPLMPVSVLIVTRNRPEFVAFVLSKLSIQVRRGDQLVLLDDASDMPASNLAQEFAQNCSVTFLRHEISSGYIPARNEGLQACRNECIVQLDDDSWIIEPNAMKICEDLITKHGRVGAFALPVYYHNARQPDECGTESSRWDGNDMEREYAFQGCGAVLRASAVKAAGLYPAYYNYGVEETTLAARLYRQGYEVRMCRQLRVIHGHEQLSATDTYKATRDQDPSIGIAGNELCLARESLCWPFSHAVSLIIVAKARASGLPVTKVLHDFQLKKPNLQKQYRLSLPQTLGWLRLRSAVALRNRIRSSVRKQVQRAASFHG